VRVAVVDARSSEQAFETESQSSIKIEAIRYVEKFLQLKPTESKKRVVVVDEAQKMTNDAANAFLKILEEPPQNAQIILIANDQKNLPMTIASRCALVRFSPVSPRLIEEWLVEDQHLLIDKAHDAAERSGGSFEKVLEVLEEGFSDFDLSQYELDEFFDEISKASWRKEGRKQAENVLNQLIENAQKKLEKGDLSQIEPLKELLKTRVAIDRHVNPRLALENIYLKLYPPFLDTK
jgi:DNA polymerase III gamma/tau subunit